MRATLFLSSLFAVSLAGSAALAERPAEGGEGRRPAREHQAREVRVHETSTVRERVAPVRVEKASPAREPRVIQERPTRGDNVDRSYAAHAAGGVAKVHQSASPDPSKTIPKIYEATRNCSELTSDCTASRSKATGKGEGAAKKDDKRELTAQQRAQAQEMIKKIQMMICERNAAACADYL